MQFSVTQMLYWRKVALFTWCEIRVCVCACWCMCAHVGFVTVPHIFLINLKHLHMTGRNEAKNLTLNSRKGNLFPLYFLQKYKSSSAYGVKMLWADIFHLWKCLLSKLPRRASIELAASVVTSFHKRWTECFANVIIKTYAKFSSSIM